MSQVAILLILISTVLHAAWNLISHRRSGDVTLFARMCFHIACFGVPLLAVCGAMGHTLPLGVWVYAAGSGVCLSVYFLGLGGGYRVGDFSVVYPLARALPILLLAGFDLWRGRDISPFGAVGMAIVIAGCVILVGSSRSNHTTRHAGRAMMWVAITAIGTVGYSAIDKLAMESVASHHWLVVAQYCCVQFTMAWPVLFAATGVMSRSGKVKHEAVPRGPVIAIAALNLTAYILILLAFQLVAHVSYVLALRQFSIVLGAIMGACLLRERSPKARIAGAMCIAVGVMVIALVV
jgi:drug/metabolite transporter (DMT)-like permease